MHLCLGISRHIQRANGPRIKHRRGDIDLSAKCPKCLKEIPIEIQGSKNITIQCAYCGHRFIIDSAPFDKQVSQLLYTDFPKLPQSKEEKQIQKRLKTLTEGELKKQRQANILKLRIRTAGVDKIRMRRAEMRAQGIEPKPLEGFD